MKNSFTYKCYSDHGTVQFLYGVGDSVVEGGEETLYTLCRIDSKFLGEVRGFAVLNPNDADDKVKGEKVALTSALGSIKFRECRKAIWNAYLEWANIQKKEVENA